MEVQFSLAKFKENLNIIVFSRFTWFIFSVFIFIRISRIQNVSHNIRKKFISCFFFTVFQVNVLSSFLCLFFASQSFFKQFSCFNANIYNYHPSKCFLIHYKNRYRYLIFFSFFLFFAIVDNANKN